LRMIAWGAFSSYVADLDNIQSANPEVRRQLKEDVRSSRILKKGDKLYFSSVSDGNPFGGSYQEGRIGLFFKVA
ncbi:MAG: hypothetical protein H7836_17820, partial [Magnetococcus sp. YQC-3]